MALNKGSPHMRNKHFMTKGELGLNSDQQRHQLEKGQNRYLTIFYPSTTPGRHAMHLQNPSAVDAKTKDTENLVKASL